MGAVDVEVVVMVAGVAEVGEMAVAADAACEMRGLRLKLSRQVPLCTAQRARWW